jgi:hypothetical protein
MACRLLVNKIMKDYFFNKLVEGVFLDKRCIYYTEKKILLWSLKVLMNFEEFGSPGSSLSCDESFLCCIWLPCEKKDDSFHDESLFCRKRFY